jgi:hypothetical protein
MSSLSAFIVRLVCSLHQITFFSMEWDLLIKHSKEAKVNRPVPQHQQCSFAKKLSWYY